ncbi:AMP-binding enzyme [Truncatella angustata]|uniref:Very long-chain fatty acid transport protein n=1 Tax=Truncatella angustata TaxID=152316 RepID=A0A9P8RFQ1_9PEZI|nr:AMP-binding enzyme [Truncatella angustata]KAH6644999.1 AMP-binding enzyme [Truncatella angustata]
MAAVAAASIAATAAGLSYIDAKYHIRKDWAIIRGRKKSAKLLQKALKEKRLSPWYFFEHNAQQKPNEECIWWRKGSYTWSEVYTRGNQFAHFFLSQGVKPGDLVALFMANSPDFVFAWLGLWAIGAAPALINHNLTKAALLHCLSISDAPLILADGRPELLARIDEVRVELGEKGVKVVKLADVKAEIGGMKAERPSDKLREDVNPGSPFGLFYTSGTTGMPKACTIPAVAGFNHGVSRQCGLAYVDGENERYYDCMPLYHGTGGISAMTQLLLGTTLCLAPKFSASRFWDDIRDSKATWFVYVGETLRYLLAAPPSPRDKDHNVHSIYGNGLRPDVWKQFRDRFGIEKIFEFFNSTEGVVQLDNPARGDFHAHSVGHHGLLLRNRFHGTFIPVAIDADSGEIARDPKTGFASRVPYDQGGEIIVVHPSVHTPPFGGYHGNKEATEKKFVRDVFRKGDVYYRSGDALRRDSDGRWYFMDRLGDTFRWKGENVSTAEVSQVLGQYPGVLEATVYGIGLPGHDGKAGMAAIYIDPERKDFDYDGLLKHARTHLPKYAVPIFIRRIKERSATHNNKQNKVPLVKEGIDPVKVNGDPIFWISDNGKGSSYVPYGQEGWDSLNSGKAKL